ncbi:MAG: iron chaperone [Gemmatimonadaceae bacterium]
MKAATATPSTIDAYIRACPREVQQKLSELRATIHRAAPDAVEKISYRMPTFFQKKNLVHFAAFKNHIGFYPAASGIASFADELSGYATSKGAVQFPIDEPLPLPLVTRIVKFRVVENEAKASRNTATKPTTSKRTMTG